MLRHALLGASLALALIGCSSTGSHDAALLAAEGPSVEMERLSRLIGRWTGTAQVVAAPASVLAAAAEAEPVDDGREPGTMLAAWEASWVLGGKFLQQVGWHETAPGVKEHYVEYVRWDDDAGKFRTWYFAESGESGQSSWVVSNDGMTISVSSQGRKADGSAFSGRGKLRFLESGTSAWSWQESGPQGRLQLAGTGTPAN